MDLQEVTRRVVLGHWKVIVACVIALAVAVSVYHFFDAPIYSASTRVVLDVAAPSSGTEALAVADSAKAIVTSPSHIVTALKAAGYQRDLVRLTPQITVAPLGTSGVLLLTVSDINPQAAAGIANALADDLIATRIKTSPAARAAILDAQIKTVEDEISALKVESAGLKDQLKNLRVDPANPQFAQVQAQILTDRITAADNEVSTLTQQLIHLDSERASLGSASLTTPSVIDVAALPSKPDPSRLPIDLALAVVVGLALGVAIAGGLETFRPTLAAGDAVARTLGVPILGWLPDTTATLPTRLKLAATAADLKALELIGIGDAPDLVALSRSLRGPLTQGEGEGKGLAIFSMADAPPRYRSAQAPAHGFVLVTPERIKKSALIPVQELITISGRPLVGLIVNRPEAPAALPLPEVKPLPRLAVMPDQLRERERPREKVRDTVDGMSQEMQSDLWGAQ
jgi:capsular polysaccharide biosynthesis protein